MRVLIADDHGIFRQGLRRLLQDYEDVAVVAEASTAGEVEQALASVAFDVLVLDLSMPSRGGLELIAQAKAQRPDLRILVMTMHGEESYVMQTMRAGADGYITKENAAEELVRALRRVHGGGRYVCSSVAERLAIGIAQGEVDEAGHARLTEREYRVFEMLVAGKRGSEIARELSLSEKTVSTHKANVLRKMKASSQAELVLYAVRHQLVAL